MKCPHCGKDADKTPQELELLERIGRNAAEAVKVVSRTPIKKDKS